MKEEQFKFSGHPNFIEWYQCYDDLSSKVWLDGMELKKYAEFWDERAIAKWNFFYRPFRAVVGRPQKKMINERRKAIQVCEKICDEERLAISREQERIRKAVSLLTIWLVMATIAAVGLLFLSKWLVLLPVAGGVLAFQKFHEERGDARAHIFHSEAVLSEKSAKIEQNRQELNILGQEIEELLKQIPRIVESPLVENWLTEELAELECVCLSEFLSRPIERTAISEYILQDFGDPRVRGILVDSWGLLQPFSQEGPFGHEGTGLGRAQHALEDKIGTWQAGNTGVPYFRLLFLQYIFPLEKNLNICSFFYDFVTRRDYGKRLETFQYNHITNYSIREVELEEPWTEDQGLASMARLLQGKTPKAFTIAVASGNHFRCVLVDEEIVDALNEWLKNEEKFKQLKSELEVEGTVQPNERARLEQEMADLVRQNQEIHLRSGRTAKAMLAHIRDSVGEYIHKFQMPA